MKKNIKVSKYIVRKVKEYNSDSLNINEMSSNPFKEFRNWYEKAESKDKYEVNRMVLSTISNNRPHSRWVLMKKFDKKITFFTNYKSNKAKEIEKNNYVAAAFHWSDLNLQIRIEGKAERTSTEENKEYFNTRDQKSRFASILSEQSKKITDEEFLEYKKKLLEEFDENKNYQCPDYWGGYNIIPDYFEFWAGKQSRAHERVVYKLVKGEWQKFRLLP